MRKLPKSVTSLVLAFAVGGLVTPASAQGTWKISPERVAAIVKCTKQAHMRYPDDDAAQHRGRYLAWEECMVDAGQTP